MIEEINDNNLTLDDFVEDMEYFMMKIKYVVILLYLDTRMDSKNYGN